MSGIAEPMAPTRQGADTAPPVLDIRQADAFYGKAQILFGVSVRVPRGKVVSLIGANGAGKSTTLNLVMGRLRASSGAVELDGRSLVGLGTEQIIAAGVACVPQRRRIFGTLTVLENLEVGAYVRRKDAAAVARTLDEVYTLFPVLKKKAHMMGGVLSGGEQQMLAIGRGLMSNPSLLLLDEPSMGISPKLTTEMFADIRRIAQTGRTVLIVEQNAYAALGISDHGYVLENGAVALEGPAAQLMHDDYVRQTYLGA
ncbi:High-affinity branched-chain amino acid transport ATP-binding protein LivF [Xylophilus ampelinus]|nr:High-affinity branched-chain amino acid transport ATP-binding protein LivF [Xylophilus ampelinus]